MKALSIEMRMEIAKGWAAGKHDREIGAAVGCSVSAVRKWRWRVKRGERSMMEAQVRVGRPKRGALSTFEGAVSAKMKQMREDHPGWGAKTLLAELRGVETVEERLPNRSSVARWLKETGYVQPYQDRQKLPRAQPYAHVSAPHQVWEIDARGHEYVAEVGVIQLININDVCSRVKLMSYPCELGQRSLTRRPNQKDYQTALRHAFRIWGLPDAISFDHDPVFVDPSSKSPFPMQLHLWLIGLGVNPTFTRPHRPTDHAITERGHQAYYHQVLERQTFQDWLALFASLNQRRDFLNTRLPCASLGEHPPLIAWPSAALPRHFYHPQLESALFDIRRVFDHLTQMRWFRPVHDNGTISLGGQTYALGRKWYPHTLEIHFDPSDQHLIFFSDPDTLIQRLPIRNLSQPILLGDLTLLDRAPAFQLALPFDPHAARVLHVCETLCSMN